MASCRKNLEKKKKIISQSVVGRANMTTTHEETEPGEWTGGESVVFVLGEETRGLCGGIFGVWGMQNIGVRL